MIAGNIRVTVLAVVVVSLLGAGWALAIDKKLIERVEDSGEVYGQLINAPDQGVPERLLKDAQCVAVIPALKKGAFIFGGKHGKGVVTCRNDSGKWSPLSFLTISGGSFGLQIGGQSSDLVLFIMSEKGARSLVRSEFTLGGDASVAAGPVGRQATADTDVALNADILAYARTKGLFAGISLDGSSVRNDGKAIKDYYGKRLDPEQILFQHQVPTNPSHGQALFDKLP
ncbi:MAG TPA: lipid-binding SYLF domain-containing protein [Acidobacteriota bacterium]|nr:lipid-binding SYLF domain-containing protein [Acidobacteriota bacterium]